MRQISGKRKQPLNSINEDAWFQHFKEILEKHGDPSDLIHVENHYNDSGGDRDDVGSDSSDSLNRPISTEEILVALRKLKKGKAAGPDGIINELLKNACKSDVVLGFFVTFFNALFDRGVYPESWTESIVLPLYKKGNVNNPNNYRGISLSNVCSKLYSSVINSRLQEWIERNNITG
eukprot:TRINITY_DN113801_c0_g1_i1.p1 TRINITY_DN113801_c0_g1~~TRINITY_DN113801_c0_g1_i1.p1  ORF type:complete len:177 (-),score=18.67 TRINITY_DN113801_c0_g1_i1:134-664(-)